MGKDDLVAQLVEHLPFKEVVLGSSPSQVTKTSLNREVFNLNFGEILKWPTRADCKSAAQASKVRILLSPQKTSNNFV